MKNHLSIESIGKRLIIVPENSKENEEAIFRIAVERICEYGGRFDIVHGQVSDDIKSMYDLIVILGNGRSDTAEDSYSVKTLQNNPITVEVTGVGVRGVLYAAYCFADILKSNGELGSLDISRSPRIKDRYVILPGSNFSGRFFRPGLFYKSLHELPRYGYNGVVLAPGGQSGTPADRYASPITISSDGSIHTDKIPQQEWKTLFQNVKRYGMELALSIAPLVPPGFSDEEIDEFYNGGKEPEGYISALQAHFEEFLEYVLTTYEELDMLIFSSTEGAEYGKNKRFFLAPEKVRNDIDALESYLDNNEKIVRAYFDVYDRVCRKHGVKAGFWTHIFGIVTPGIRRLREILFEHSDIINIEDDYWNNNLWIYDLPIMNYLPDDLRADVPVKSKFAMMQWCIDAEYYGGGSLPDIYPDTQVRSAREAVEHGACMLMQRINLHDRTSRGTLFNSVEIIPFAASRQAWEPSQSMDELWDEWARRRYGNASEHVVLALKNSKDIALNGLQVNGVNLILHTAIFVSEWSPGCPCFKLFGKSGQLLIPKTHDDIVFSGEYSPFQMKTTAIPIVDFQNKQDFALKKVHESLQHVENAKDSLHADDYAEFKQIYQDGEIVLGALKLLGEAAYAANLVLDSFDNIENPSESLSEAIKNLENYNETIIAPRGEDLLYPPAYEQIKQIAETYRNLLQKT